MEKLEITPWIAWQSYSDKNSNFIVVSDSLTHTFGVIEGDSADLWAECFPDSKSRRVCGGASAKYPEFIAALKDEGIVREFGDEKIDSIPLETPAPIHLSSEATKADLEYQSLEDRLKSRVESIGKLWTFFWETTYACNEKCIHCFNPGASHSPDEKSTRSNKTFEKARVTTLLDELREIGVFRIVFSGGEFFVNQDWEYILDEAHKRNFEIHIFTNGLLLDETRLEKLCHYWPQSVSISIYSHDPDTHDKITRTPFSHQYSIHALKRLRERGIKTTIKCPLMKFSADDIDAIIELGKALGARVSFDAMISAGNDGNQSPTQLNSSWKQLLMLALEKSSPIYVGDKDRNYGSMKKDPDMHVCGAGRSIMSMTPDGRLTPCCSLPIEVADLNNESIKNVWETAISGGNHSHSENVDTLQKTSPLMAWRDIKLKDYYECGTHDRCSWCHKCPGSALNESGDVLTPSLVQCKIASARMSVANLLKSNISQDEILHMIHNDEISEPEFASA